MKKNILIINTGGTISSVKTKEGLIPKNGVIEKIINKQPQFFHPDLPSFTLVEFDPLIDSSNVTFNHWNQLSKMIEEHYAEYDGFVILHGTDTLAYSASALSFLLDNLEKPVILTGSQIPFNAIRSDASDNLLNALELACDSDLMEVCVYFNHKLFRGNRATKKSSDRFLAFDSPNFPSLAHVGTEIRWQKSLFLRPKSLPFITHQLKPCKIANLRLFPGFSNEVLAQLLNLNLDGLILESYGSGNVPSKNCVFLKQLERFSEQNTVVVNLSQCYQTSASQSPYLAGKVLEKLGVISGFDLTREAAHTKLQCLLSQSLTSNEIKQKMVHSLKGELSSQL